jgi:type I restriction enzyme, S subunit
LVRSRNFIESISEKVQGALYPAAKSTDVRRFEFGLPPLAEQQQIAQKLDELLAQVDTLKTRLDAIPNILKRFRQSVLAAAVSGRLTEEWRGVQVEKLDEWRWVTLGEIADVKGGITKDSKKQESSFVELPYLRVANVQRYYLDLTEIKTIRIPESRVKDLLLEDGDILFNEGGDLDKLGRGWIWEGQIQNCSFQNHVFRARLKDKSDNPKYISWWGNTEGLEYFIRNGKQTTNLASINKTLLSNLPINLPPAKEQTEIVRRVEQLFAYADQIEQRVKDAQARVNHLTQSILAKAFRGELTADWRAQNPELISGENSAAALLERIKVEREAIAKPKRKVKV